MDGSSVEHRQQGGNAGSSKRQKLGDGSLVESRDLPAPAMASGSGGAKEETTSDSDDEKGESDYDSDSSGDSTLFENRGVLENILDRIRDDDEEESDEEEESDDDSFDGPAREFGVRVAMINGACGTSFRAMEVRGSHRKGCDDCHSTPANGSNYAVDRSDGVYDAPKLCEDCVNRRSDVLFQVTEDPQQYRQIKKIRRQLEKKFFMFNPFMREGLYEVGLNGPFRINDLGGPKLFKEHMKSKGPW